MPNTDDSFTTDGGAPVPISMPTVNASLNVWGTMLNAGLNLVATALKYTQGLITAIQAAATALALRVTTLEARTSTGVAGWKTGQYFFPATGEGLEEELVVLDGNAYLVPFFHIGAFTKVVLAGSSPSNTWKIVVFDTDANGAVVSSPTLAEATYTGTITGYVEIALTFTPKRPYFVGVQASGGQLYLRGTTGAAPRWSLGASGPRPTAVGDIAACLRGSTFAGPFTAANLGAHGWAPAISLKT